MIRKAREEDLEMISRIYVDAWKTVYRGIIPQEVLDHLTYKEQREKWQTVMKNEEEQIFVYISENGIAGFISFFIRDSEQVEITAFYFEEKERRKGYGKKLIEYIISEFGRGKEVKLWCIKENPNRTFYEKMGGRMIDEKFVKIGGKDIQGIQFLF